MTDDDYWAYHTLTRHIYRCGCGNPETVWALVRDVLHLMPLYDGRWDECATLIGSYGAFHIVLDRMSDAGLIEHGGGIGGSWITPDGERMLAALDAVDDLAGWDELVDGSDDYWAWLEAHDDTVRP